jgi:hypothetical protein
MLQTQKPLIRVLKHSELAEHLYKFVTAIGITY